MRGTGRQRGAGCGGVALLALALALALTLAVAAAAAAASVAPLLPGLSAAGSSRDGELLALVLAVRDEAALLGRSRGRLQQAVDCGASCHTRAAVQRIDQRVGEPLRMRATNGSSATVAAKLILVGLAVGPAANEAPAAHGGPSVGTRKEHGGEPPKGNGDSESLLPPKAGGGCSAPTLLDRVVEAPGCGSGGAGDGDGDRLLEGVG